jgi:hypothetical protein
MTFLVVGYVQETIDGDYARKNRVVVRANFIVYVSGMQERLQESKTESIIRSIRKAKQESMLRQTCFTQHARTTKQQNRYLRS